MFTLNCKGRLLTLDKPVVMGIINVTPDSFYEGSRVNNDDAIVGLADKMIRDGAAILDVGGQSTRPGSSAITEEEEISRVIPAIRTISNAYPEIVISVDTYHAKVAAEAVAAGASMVNDISGGMLDKNMLSTVAQADVPYICMHMKGDPSTMQDKTDYQDLCGEILDYFIERSHQCKITGIKDVIIDPGFGFSKSIAQNFRLLRHLQLFKVLDRPILAGLSRKSTIYKTLGIEPAEALNGTTVMHTLALENGANILRVHDVKEAVEAISLHSAYHQA